MSIEGGACVVAEPPQLRRVSFRATDVTNSHEVSARDVQADLPAGVVAESLARQMRLPSDVPWTLRDDSTSAYLEDRLPIGEQIEPQGSHLTVTGHVHLG